MKNDLSTLSSRPKGKSKLKIIENKENIGFGKANNQGMKKSRGKYILLLNSDTLLKDNVLGEMVHWMDNHPKAGASSCALRNKDGSLQGTGGYFPNLPKVASWMFFVDDLPVIDQLLKPFHPMHPKSFFNKGDKSFSKTQPRDWLTGAFLLIRSEAFKQTGYFDEDYFMYVEEVDYCFRLKRHGWQIWYLPRWSITHYGGASGTNELAIVSEYKGLVTFYKKHKSSWQGNILKLLLRTGALARIIIFGILEGGSSARTYAKAFKNI